MTNARQHVKRYENWKRNFASTSTFMVVCGFIAVVYFFYRIVLVAFPLVALEQSAFNPPSTAQVICQEDEGSKLGDPIPVLSTAYQERIQRQKSVTPNMVVNADLSQIDSDTDNPVGYSHSIDDESAGYEYLTDPGDTAKFLRVTNTKDRGKDQVLPTWQMNSVTLPDGRKTYAYSFKYRSAIPVNVSLESVIGGQTHYSDVTTLDPTGTSWQLFTADFDNVDNATSLRMDINGVGLGHVDTKSFDIHQIPDANLSKGIVSVTFDDGWRSVSDHALSLLQKYDIHTTQYIITEAAEHKVAGYMNYDMIAKLKAAGNEIGSHSLNHCNQTELPIGSLQNNAVKSKQALEDHALGSIKTFAYPLGQYSKTTQEVYEKQYPLIRTSDTGYNDRYYDETDVHSMAVLSDTGNSTFQSWLTYAKEHKLWVVLAYHRVDESGDYSVTSEQLEGQLKMIKESGLTVLPMSDAASLARK